MEYEFQPEFLPEFETRKPEFLPEFVSTESQPPTPSKKPVNTRKRVIIDERTDIASSTIKSHLENTDELIRAVIISFFFFLIILFIRTTFFFL